jgi:uncharacterized protein DUF6755
VGGRDPQVIRAREERAVRARGMTVVYAVMLSIALLLAIQFLLLMVAVEGFVAGRAALLVPSALGSGVCFLAACRLVGYLSAPRTRGS